MSPTPATSMAIRRRGGAGFPRWQTLAPGVARYWFLALAALLFAAPGLGRLAREVWSLEQGAQGPLILASGVWLLAREARGPITAPRPAILFATLPPTLLVHVFARVVGMLWLEWLTTYVALVCILYGYVGGAAIRRLWFPLTYLLFLVPPPYALIAPLTHSRKLWLSTTAVDLLSLLRFDVAVSGTTLYIDQYELLIADACAGMNSLFSLLAIGSLYIYLRHRANWRYAALLAMLVVPIAMLANLARVLILLLVTHYLGDSAGQGPLHDATGMIMFVVALTFLVLADALLGPLRRRLPSR